MRTYAITNGQLVLKEAVVQDHALVVRDGVITDVTRDASRYSGLPVVDAEGGYVTPGLVELHIHGCGGVGFDAEEAGSVDRACAFLRTRGINTVVPTVQCSEETLERITGEIGSGAGGTSVVPGLYVEGPFVHPERRGGIDPHHVAEPDLVHLQRLLKLTRGRLKMMTIAPDLAGIEAIAARLRSEGILVCLGHSNCTMAQAEQLLDEGPTVVTHLFNAMSGVSHRQSGLAMLPFVRRDVWSEVNADGVHVTPDCLRLCAASLNPERMILISDAVIAAGTKGGSYEYFGKPVVSGPQGVRYADSDVLIGSRMLVNEIVGNSIAATGTPVYVAVRAATYNPCCLLGLERRRGSLEVGKEADVVVFDRDFNLKRNLAA